MKNIDALWKLKLEHLLINCEKIYQVSFKLILHIFRV